MAVIVSVGIDVMAATCGASHNNSAAHMGKNVIAEIEAQKD
jgi:hypothetical protein